MGAHQISTFPVHPCTQTGELHGPGTVVSRLSGGDYLFFKGSELNSEDSIMISLKKKLSGIRLLKPTATQSGSLASRSVSGKTAKQELSWTRRRVTFLSVSRWSIVSSFFFYACNRHLYLLSGFVCCQQMFELGTFGVNLVQVWFKMPGYQCTSSSKACQIYNPRLWNVLVSQKATASYYSMHPKDRWARWRGGATGAQGGRCFTQWVTAADMDRPQQSGKPLKKLTKQLEVLN